MAVATMTAPERTREILTRVLGFRGFEYDELHHDLRAFSEREWWSVGALRFDDVPFYAIAELLRRFRRELERG